MHKHYWEQISEPTAFSFRGPISTLGWRTKLCCLFLFCSQLCISFYKNQGWTAQLKSKPSLPRLCNVVALSQDVEKHGYRLFQAEQRIEQRSFSPQTSEPIIWYGKESSVQVLGWKCFTSSSCITYNRVTETQIHSICKHQTSTWYGCWVPDQTGRQHLSTCRTRPQASWESADFGCQAELLPS